MAFTPHQEYKFLLKQAYAMNNIIENLEHRNKLLSERDYKASEKRISELEKQLESEKEMNHILTCELEQLRTNPMTQTNERALFAALAHTQEHVEPIYIIGKGWQCDVMPPDSTKVYLHPPKQPLAVPSGWKLVPIEPTPEMIKQAFYIAQNPNSLIKDAYKAMLNATPTPPESE